jgi:hypothetical protein
MRNFILILIITVLAGCTNMGSKTFQEVQKLAERDDKSLSPELNAASLEASGTVLDKVTEYCPIEKESFTVVFEVNKEGYIQKSWTDTNSEKMQCLNSKFKNMNLFKPPQEPFYTSLTWSGGPSLTGHNVIFPENASCNPAIKATGILTEENGVIVLSELKVSLSNNPIYKERSVYIKNIRIRLNQSTEEGKTMCCEYGNSVPGWDCGVDGEPVVINRVIGNGESLMLSKFELKLDTSPLKLDHRNWSSIEIIVESDKRIANTGGVIGFL